MANVRVLVVDDEDFNRQYLRICLEAAGFELDEAADGVAAWETLQQNPDTYDAILLDRRMPEMDGMQVLEKLKADTVLRHIPVVMQTALDREQDIIEAMQAGVYYYLTKPYDGQVLVSVVRSATDEFARHQRLQVEVAKRAGAISLMTAGKFVLRTPKEADALAILLASGLDRSAAVAMGLSELLINAIEHGNLELDYANKTDLIAEGEWDTVIEARLNEPEFRARRVAVDVSRNSSETTFTIVDEGKGFDWKNYVDLTMERVFDTHGRGIAMAKKLAFSKLEYKGVGNIVEVTVSHQEAASPKRVETVDSGTAAVVQVVDPNDRLVSVIEALEEVDEVSVARSATVSTQAEPALWIVSSEALGAQGKLPQNISENLIVAGNDWNVEQAESGMGATGQFSVPADGKLIEGIARCLLAPQTMEIGGEADLRLGPELASHQLKLLPDPAGLSGPSWTLTANSEGCTGVSGDLWGGFALDEDRIALFVADFTGHGPVAGIQTFRLRTTIGQLPLVGMAPGQVMGALNANLNAVLPTSHYTAMLYGIVDVREGSFTYAGAGTPHPLVFGKNGNVLTGDGKGLPLGVSPDFTYVERTLPLGGGDTLVILTDGLFNMIEGESPGADAFDKFAAYLSGRAAEDTLARRLNALIDSAERPLSDDVSALCLTVNP